MDTQHSTEENTTSNQTNKRKFPVALSITLFIWVAFFSIWLGGVWFFSSFIQDEHRFGSLPSLKELENPETQIASEIYSSDSVLLGKYFSQNRTYIPYEDLSPIVKNTLFATEDIRFFDHYGIDVKGIASIPFYLLKGKKKGASTITQQLAKNLFRTRAKEFDGEWTKDGGKIKTAVDKFKEWIVAARIEAAYTKEEILTMYLNTVDFGQNSFGIEVAAKTYFNKDQSQLNYAEAAALIGLLKATSKYNPRSNPNDANERRKVVFSQLHKYEYLDDATYDSLINTRIKLEFTTQGHNQGKARYFREEAKKFLKDWCAVNGYNIYKDGLVIYTTLDSKMQTHAESSLKNHIKEHQGKFDEHWGDDNPWTYRDDYDRYREIKNFLDVHIKRTYAYQVVKRRYDKDSVKMYKALKEPKKMTVFSWNGSIDTVMSSYDSLAYYKKFLHAGFMTMDPFSGQIKTWVGGINYNYFKYDHVQHGKRQPGSTFKPIVYTAILGEIGNKYGPCFKAVDEPVTFETSDPENPIWSPGNAEGKFSGDTMTLRQALARSKNSITAYMMKILGPQTPRKVLDYATRLGINTESFEAVPSMCLGTFDVSLFDMVGAYGTFVNKGVHTEPYFITAIYDRHGNLLQEFKPKTSVAISPELAQVMLHMLRGGTQEKGGTGLGLYRYGVLADNEIGTKTGTTQDFSDGWFMGVTHNLVGGVWVGAEDRVVHFKTIELGQGSKMALPIFGNFLKTVYADSTIDLGPGRFARPSAAEKAKYSIIMDCEEYEQEKSNEDLFEQKEIEMFDNQSEDEDDDIGF